MEKSLTLFQLSMFFFLLTCAGEYAFRRFGSLAHPAVGPSETPSHFWLLDSSGVSEASLYPASMPGVLEVVLGHVARIGYSWELRIPLSELLLCRGGNWLEEFHSERPTFGTVTAVFAPGSLCTSQMGQEQSCEWVGPRNKIPFTCGYEYVITHMCICICMYAYVSICVNLYVSMHDICIYAWISSYTNLEDLLFPLYWDQHLTVI